VVAVVAVGDHGVQAVVAAGHLDDHEDTVLARLGRPGRRGEEAGDRRSQGDER
jgi:hypothetical protein